MISPIGQIDRKLIASEKANFDRIVATLGLKEMSQSTLVRKLCTLSGHHRTRKAIFEFDKLIRSIYTLRYLRDPQLQRNVHRSQNRIESYHQLRSAIAQVGGKKELTGHRHRNRDHQPVCAADGQRHHLLQLGNLVTTTHEVRSEWECEGPGHAQENLAGGLAP